MSATEPIYCNFRLCPRGENGVAPVGAACPHCTAGREGIGRADLICNCSFAYTVREEKFHDHGYFHDGCKVNVLAYAHAEEIWDKISALSQTQEADRLTIAALVEVIRYVSDYATAHHSEQESHVLLHSLTVDIPALCEAALRARVPDGVPEILHQLDFEMEERIVRAVEEEREERAYREEMRDPGNHEASCTCGDCRYAEEEARREHERAHSAERLG